MNISLKKGKSLGGHGFEGNQGVYFTVTVCARKIMLRISKDVHPSGEPDHPQSLHFSAFAV
jgi:hypothetical protein